MNRSHAIAAPDYGIDAPPVVRNLLLAGVGAIAAGVAANIILATIQAITGQILLIWGAVSGGSMLLTALLMIWSSKVGKLHERERLIDLVNLRGDETVLDVGCGRGLLLNAAAKRLTTGRAVGVDLWQSEDQSNNTRAATLANAHAEGVAGRVEVRTADMQHLPFEDNSFDVVVSSLAIHNVYDQAGRARAIHEIARVVKPGGRVALLDMQHTDEYAAVLKGLGWRNVERSRLHFSVIPPVRVVTAAKGTTAISL